MKKSIGILTGIAAVLAVGVFIWWKVSPHAPARTEIDRKEYAAAEDGSGDRTDSEGTGQQAVSEPSDAKAAVPEPAEEEISVSASGDYPAMIRVDGILYYDSGQISDALRCGTMDGQITSYADGEPTEDGQSNFERNPQDAGLGYQYWQDGEIHVFYDGAWHIFLPYDMTGYEDGDSPTGEEKTE